MNRKMSGFGFVLGLVLQMAASALGQGVQPYPNTITDRLVRQQTAMAPPAARVVFQDPDFGSSMVRVTDNNTDLGQPETFFVNADGVTNEWSLDSKKFFVLAGQKGGLFAFGFDPVNMAVLPLPGADAAGVLRVPLRLAATFSSTNPDLIYGTSKSKPYTLSAYHFSTAKTSAIADLTACGTQPALASGVTTDISTSVDDQRFVVSAGGNQFGNRTLVVVYDRKLGCRWYNTQTGQIGGSWGTTGTSTAPSFFIRHSHISGNGRYVKISLDALGFYVWDLNTLNVTACSTRGPLKCGGYGAMGSSTYINPAGSVGALNFLKRPLSDVTGKKNLLDPTTLPKGFRMEEHSTWQTGRFNDNAPVCGATHSTDGSTYINAPFDNEIFCMATDGTSTVWRVAHNRVIWDPEYYWSQPFGNISSDGRFYLFSSSWDNQVGVDSEGDPRSDTWIVKVQ